MSRFSQAFLRDKLDGWACLAAFGKHPAWNDHIGLIGTKTETLALLEDILYRRGIAGQIAADKWSDPQDGPKTPLFNNRFVWGRENQQSLAGALWPSIDGKGRGHFPFVCCVQSAVNGTVAVQIYLEYVVKVGTEAREASNQAEVLGILERGGYDLNRWGPVVPTAMPWVWRSEQRPALFNALGSLAQEAVRSDQTRQAMAADGQHASLRLPALAERGMANLWLYAAFLEQFSPPPRCYLLICSADRGAPVDCVLGEPRPDAFFCLGADLKQLPVATPPLPAALPKGCHQGIDRFLAACASGRLPSPVRRPFWRWFVS